ncbi:DMP19 family protein [Aquimarina longa]|uniref:DMP19 family protein n=1 Tax=Aquimarina longa TaxID=1080221 RepID=UPI0007847D1F|nr:DUF4375 domain-containing protein [Aquimarina longa]
MSISKIEQEWFDYTIHFVEKLNENNQDWSKLNKDEQELAALWKLEMDVHNGGFLQFFTNWGWSCYENAIRCLKKIEANNSLRIIETAYAIIDKHKDDNRLKTLNDLYHILSNEEVDIIDKLDHEYWDVPDDIPKLTFKQYKK